jgi:hypothetical protein
MRFSESDNFKAIYNFKTVIALIGLPYEHIHRGKKCSRPVCGGADEYMCRYTVTLRQVRIKFCLIICTLICTSSKLQPPVYPQIKLIAFLVFAKFVIEHAQCKSVALK